MSPSSSLGSFRHEYMHVIPNEYWPMADVKLCTLNWFWFLALKSLWVGLLLFLLYPSFFLFFLCYIVPAFTWKPLGLFAPWTMEGSRSCLSHIFFYLSTRLNWIRHITHLAWTSQTNLLTSCWILLPGSLMKASFLLAVAKRDVSLTWGTRGHLCMLPVVL